MARIKWKKVRNTNKSIKYQGLGRFNEVVITKTVDGWSVLRSNPNNAVTNHFKKKQQALSFSRRWMETKRN